MTFEKWHRNAGMGIIALFVFVIVAVMWADGCPGDAQAAEHRFDSASAGAGANPSRDTRSPTELSDIIAQQEQDAVAALLFEIAAWAVGTILAILFLVALVKIVARKIRAARAADALASSSSQDPATRQLEPPKPQCPACRRPTDSEFVPLPRLVRPRRTVAIGSYTLTLPDLLDIQRVKVCELCHEVALTLVHIEQAKLTEQRAKDERLEIERLVDVQKGLLDRIKEIRFPPTTGSVS